MTRAQLRGQRRISWGRVQDRVIRKGLPLRCLWLVLGLKARYQAGKHARLYCGDATLAREMHRRIGRCSESSVYRAKKDLEALHLIAVTHTVGGSTHNPAGEVVAAATGYEPHPDLYQLTEDERKARQPHSERAVRAQQLLQRSREQLAAVRARAGP